MALDKAAVAHIAALARIRLAEAELEPLAAELSQILTWVEQLSEVDTAGVRADDQRRGDAAADARRRGDRRRLPRRVLGNAPRAAQRASSPCRRWSSERHLPTLTLAEARDGLRARKFSARELTQAHIAAIEAARPLNAFITETPERALDMAAAADERLGARRGRALDGIPLAIKDLFCTKGVLTTAASHILDGFIPPYESTVTENLWQAGAVMLGKTNLDEFAMGSSNTTSHYGPVENPWRRARAITGRWCRAARPAARPRRWRRVPRSARPAPIPAARSASRRAFAASSG